MPLNTLVPVCLINGLTYEDSKVTIQVEPAEHEKVLFFKTDSENFRKLVHSDPYNGEECDLLVYYNDVNTKNIIFCFTELKYALINSQGKNLICSAVDQLIATKKDIVKLREDHKCDSPEEQCVKRCEQHDSFFKSIIWIAYICHKVTLSSQIDQKTHIKRLKDNGFEYSSISTVNDISNFLREKNKQGKNYQVRTVEDLKPKSKQRGSRRRKGVCKLN